MESLKLVLILLIPFQGLINSSLQQDTEHQERNLKYFTESNVSSLNLIKSSTTPKKFQELPTFVPAAKWSPGTGTYPKPGKAFVAGVGKGDAYTEQELRSIEQVRLGFYLSIYGISHIWNS